MSKTWILMVVLVAMAVALSPMDELRALNLRRLQARPQGMGVAPPRPVFPTEYASGTTMFSQNSTADLTVEVVGGFFAVSHKLQKVFLDGTVVTEQGRGSGSGSSQSGPAPTRYASLSDVSTHTVKGAINTTCYGDVMDKDTTMDNVDPLASTSIPNLEYAGSFEISGKNASLWIYRSASLTIVQAVEVADANVPVAVEVTYSDEGGDEIIAILFENFRSIDALPAAAVAEPRSCALDGTAKRAATGTAGKVPRLFTSLLK